MKKISLLLLGGSTLLLTGCSSVSGFVGGFFTGVFTFLGLWYIFWPLAAAIVLTIGYFVEDKESHVIGTIVWLAILFTLIGVTSSNFHPIDFMKENSWKTLLIIVGYFVMAVVWSLIKLRMLGKKYSRDWERNKQEFLSYKNRTEEDWITSVKEGRSVHVSDFSRHEHKIFSWAVYWPFSMVWYFISDFLKDLWDFIYTRMKKIYRYVYERAIGNILADQRKAAESKNSSE